jgi:hypothetical protein
MNLLGVGICSYLVNTGVRTTNNVTYFNRRLARKRKKKQILPLGALATIQSGAEFVVQRVKKVVNWKCAGIRVVGEISLLRRATKVRIGNVLLLGRSTKFRIGNVLLLGWSAKFRIGNVLLLGRSTKFRIGNVLLLGLSTKFRIGNVLLLGRSTKGRAANSCQRNSLTLRGRLQKFRGRLLKFRRNISCRKH